TKSGLGASAYSGGICGSNGSSVSTNGSVYICYNAGNVTAVNPGSLYGNGVYAGGISGSGPQKNCFNTGAISATGAYYSYAGGIAGRIDTGSSINNYNIGTVNASNGSQTTMSGGISTSKNVSNSYCLDLYGSEYGTQLTSAQMKNKVNFVGFDFNAIWDISPTVNNGYPHLRAFTSQTEPPVPTTAPVPTTTMPAPTTTNNSGGGGGGNNSPTTTQTPTTTQPTTTSPGGDNTTQPSKTIFNTRYVSTFWNWFKFIVLFGFIWMWFI
ncbi:MAG: hypothetical protein FWH42_06295, partial [Dehalococcoidia bacterium]|nr:hypothetical protein [Dehalococcoidia bacterium]